MENEERRFNIRYLSIEKMAEETILEEVDLTTEDGEDNALNFPPLAQFGNEKTTVPGLIASARVDDSASEPYAEDGALVIPRGMIQGEITSVQPGAGWSVSGGVVQVGYASGGAPGVISGAEISKTTSKVPVIGNGVIIFPLAQAYGGANGTTADTPGAIAGIEYVDGFCLGIVDGVIQLPKPPEQTYFPTGLYNAATGEKISWRTFLSGSSPVPMSQPTNGLRIMAFHLGEYLTFYLENV